MSKQPLIETFERECSAQDWIEAFPQGGRGMTDESLQFADHVRLVVEALGHCRRVLAVCDSRGGTHRTEFALEELRRTAVIIVDQPSDLASVYRRLLERSDLAASEIHERFYEIGSLEGIRDLEQHLSNSGKAS